MKMTTWKKTLALLLVLVLVLACTACGSKKVSNEDIDLNSMSLEEIEEKAKENGHIESVGMPDTWANWGETWDELEEVYGITQNDTDMGSAEELALFEAEKDDATKDIGDVGMRFGPVAIEMGVAKPYKTSYWDEIPDWAKDEEGNWIVAYFGTTCIMVNDTMVDEAPTSFQDILEGDYKVSIGNVVSAAQSQNAVVASVFAMGGDLSNVQPGIDFWKTLAEQGRLDPGDNRSARWESGEIACAVMDDYNALAYRDNSIAANPDYSFSIAIPTDGAVKVGYSTILNAYSKNIYAAALAREYILSDEGQINLAKGYATPIRDVELPADLMAKRIPAEQYANAIALTDFTLWEEASAQIAELWQEEVLPLIQ